MPGQPTVHVRYAILWPPGEFLSPRPAKVRADRTAQEPQVAGIPGAEILDLLLMQNLADGLEEALAVLLDQRLEKSQAEHFPFTPVNAGSQIIVNVVAQEMALEKRAAAVGFHEQLDGGFFEGFTAENLGDNALQLPAVPLIDEPRAPGHECVAADNEGGQSGDTAF